MIYRLIQILIQLIIFSLALDCGENEEYTTKSDCPKTCEYPDGNYDCGDKSKVEGCFCKDGYVLKNGFPCQKPHFPIKMPIC